MSCATTTPQLEYPEAQTQVASVFGSRESLAACFTLCVRLRVVKSDKRSNDSLAPLDCDSIDREIKMKLVSSSRKHYSPAVQRTD